MNEKKLVPNDRMCKYELDNHMQNVARPCKPAELLFNRKQMTNAHLLVSITLAVSEKNVLQGLGQKNVSE